MTSFAGIQSLAVRFPAGVRTNDYFRERYPAAVAMAEDKTLSRMFSPPDTTSSNYAFDIEMKPYLTDPFRGTVERRVLGPGESARDLELQAAKDALAAAKLQPGDVDALIAASFIPDTLGAGNAAYLCRDLGVKGPGWNLESACSGSVVALQNAAALVRAGEYRRVLVVTSCTYTRMNDEADSLSWFMGDGAGAFVVGSMPDGEGVLGSKIVSTQETCGCFYLELSKDARGEACIRMRAGESAGRVMRDTAAPQLIECCRGAIAAAGLSIEDIAFFVFNTPLAWFASFAARALEIEPERTISMYPSYGNMGPMLVPANLFHAAHSRRIRKGDLVLVYSVGTVSTAGAIVMRWGDVPLGPPPPPSSELPRR